MITALGQPWGTPFVLDANQVCNHCFGHDDLLLFYIINTQSISISESLEIKVQGLCGNKVNLCFSAQKAGTGLFGII